ncbi:rhodanese-like domain-containing protein [bacterium]|nr:rhodanese-like domain-containing protein [bacterium]
MNNRVEFFQSKLDFETDPADLFEALKNGESIIVIDARQPENYVREHIPGAINFPHRTMNAESVKFLDKEKLYVTYCDGIGCNGSTKGALNLSRLGFNVKELIGGIEWWKRDGFATEGSASHAAAEKIACGC